MTQFVGLGLYIAGCMTMLAFFISYLIDRNQNLGKGTVITGLIIFSLIVALLTLLPNDVAKLLFAWLAFIFPVLVVFFLGGLLLVLAILQGTNSISLLLFGFFCGGLITLAGSILVLARIAHK